jgi:tetratricopeptide (TPR) repeat protein
LDADNYLNHYLLGRLQEVNGNPKAALKIYDKVRQLNPSFSNAYRASGSTKVLIGDLDGAISDIRYAMEIDPLHDWSYEAELARALWAANKCEDALEAMQQVPELPARSWPDLAVIQVCVGDVEEARETIVKLIEAIPNRTLQFEIDRYSGVWTNPGVLERWLDDLRTAGMPE